MSNLIVGSVTPTTARIWVRGEKKKYARASRRASWEIHRTKLDLPPPLTGSFVL